MTRRALALLLTTLVVVALGAAAPALLVTGMVLFVIAAALVVIDWRRAPGSDRVSVERGNDALFSVGRANPVMLTVRAPRTASLLLRDAAPGAMIASAQLLPLRGSGETGYTLTPRARGDAAFGRVHVRSMGPWGLATRDFTSAQAHSSEQQEDGPVAPAGHGGLAAAGQQLRNLLGLQTLGQMRVSPTCHRRHGFHQGASEPFQVQEAKQRAQPLDPILGGAEAAVPALLLNELGDRSSVQHLDSSGLSHHVPVEEQPRDVFVLDHGRSRHAALDDKVVAVSGEQVLDRPRR